MKAGLTARIAACRSAADCGSSREALAPAHGPFVEGGGIGELRPDAVVVGIRGGIAQAAEGEGEVGLVLRHRVEQVLHQRLVAVARGEQADLPAQAGLIGGR